MNLKTLYISAAVLGLAALAVNRLAAPDKAPPLDPRVGSSLVAEAALANVASIELKADGKTVSIKSDAETNRWLVAERHDLPAAFSKLSGQIKTLVDTRLQKVATSNPDRASELGFDSPKTIVLKSADGKEILSLETGRAAENGRQFVRFAGETKIFQADAAVSLDADAEAWLDKKLVSIEQDKITSLDFTLANGDTLKANRLDKDTPWILAEGELPEGKVLDQDALTRAAGSLSRLTFTKTAKLEDAAPAKEHSHQIAIGTNAGKTYTLAIGRVPEVKGMKDRIVDGEDGQKKVEAQEEVLTPAGPVYFSITAASESDPLNGYAKKTAFETSAYQFTSLPDTQSKLLKTAPPPPAPAEEPTAEESLAPPTE